MWRDHALPPGMPSGTTSRHIRDVHWQARRWLIENRGAVQLQQLIDLLRAAQQPLADLPAARLWQAWRDCVEEFRRPRPGSETAKFLEDLAQLCGLSSAGTKAALDAVLEGVSGPPARDFLITCPHRATGGPATVILASNLPGLAVQSLLPALAVRCPLLIKTASAEPLFAPFWIERLGRREPVLGQALAALTWRGGDQSLESPVLTRSTKVVAYGSAETMADLRRRAIVPVVAHGPKMSLALVGKEVDPSEVAAGLARDIALLDQRGCLSIQAIVTAGDPEALARAVADQLQQQARTWPPGRASLAAQATVRQTRDEAIMQGSWVAELALEAGTVIVEDSSVIQPSPGLRTVRIHAAGPETMLTLLEPWREQLQGVALAGESLAFLEPELRRLGVTWIAAPGALQRPIIASWANGGIEPAEAFL